MITVIVIAILAQQQGVQLLDEGVPKGQVNQIDCIGTGVACAVAAGSKRGTVTITTSSDGGSSGGTVTDVSVVTANGVSGSVATSTTTPAITLTLGAITPSSVAASGTVTGSNLSGTNTGNVTVGAFGSSPNADGITLTGQLLNLQPASTSFPGGWSTGNQTFPGGGFVKTFDGQHDHNGIIRMMGTTSIQFFGGSANFIRYVTNYLTGMQINGDNIEFTANGAGIVRANSNMLLGLDKTLAFNDTFTATVQSNVTADRTITLPDATGTLVVGGGTASGTNTGDQTITLTGGVTGSGTGSFAATVITNANLTGPVTSVGNATTIGAGQVSDGNLANNYSGVGTCTNQFARVLNDNAAPTCASVAIADHSATGTPSATTFYRGDNTWATPASGSGNAVEVTVTMPSDASGWAQAVVTGQTWVTATSKIVCQPFNDGGVTNNTDEVYSVADFATTVSTRVVGTGFTLTAASPRGASGVFKFHCLGV